jgi:hypothetical protein
VLSLADFCLTCWLLSLPGGQVAEGNPVARWWLTRFGWLGLAGFKVALVALVAGLALLISRYRPRTGGLVLGFGCAALTAVLLHSASLCRPALRSAEAWDTIRRRGQELDGELPKARQYQALLERAGADLLAGRCTLVGAVDVLAASEKGQDPVWLGRLAEGYGRSCPRECLAVNLLLSVAMSLSDSPQSEGPPAVWAAVSRLEREFQLTFGKAPPARLRKLLREAGCGDGEPSYPVGTVPPGPAGNAAASSAL